MSVCSMISPSSNYEVLLEHMKPFSMQIQFISKRMFHSAEHLPPLPHHLLSVSLE